MSTRWSPLPRKLVLNRGSFGRYWLNLTLLGCCVVWAAAELICFPLDEHYTSPPGLMSKAA